MGRPTKGLTDKRFLGWLCPHGHDHKGTGKSLRYKSNSTRCVVCHRTAILKWKVNHVANWKAITKKSRDKPKNKRKANKYNKWYYKNVVKPKRESEEACSH